MAWIGHAYPSGAYAPDLVDRPSRAHLFAAPYPALSRWAGGWASPLGTHENHSLIGQPMHEVGMSLLRAPTARPAGSPGQRPGWTVRERWRAEGPTQSRGDKNNPRKCIALLRAAARPTLLPPSVLMRRGLKQRVLDMALGDLLSATCGGWAMSGQRLGVRSLSSDGGDRWVLFARAMWFMVSCGGGSLHRCLGSPEVS